MADVGDNCEVESGEDTITSSHGHKLFCKFWKPQSKNDSTPILKHLVFISHGAAEHCQRHSKIATKLAQHDNYVFSHDHVGHGKSEGDRVHINDFSIYVDDVISHVEKIKKEFPDIPCFILGFSMGGLMTILASLRLPDLFNGLILIAPALMADKKTVSNFSFFCAKVLGFIAPQAKVADIKTELLCRDKEVCKSHEDDELTWHGGLKAKFTYCLIKATLDVQNHLSEIKIPYILLHGSADQICNVEGSRLMHEKTSSEDKTFKVYEDGFHEVFNEIDGQGEQVINDIVEWIDKR